MRRARSFGKLTLLGLTVVLAMAGCGNGRSDDQASDGVQASTTTAASPVVTGAPTNPPPILEEDGLGFLDSPSDTSISHVRFGDPLATSKAALTKFFGVSPKEQDQQDCGPGPLHSLEYPDVTAYYDDAGFAGWFVRSGALTNAAGIGVGSRRSQLLVVFPGVEINDTSLGVEWFTGSDDSPGLSGTLESAKPDAKVTAVWAGMTCIAR